MKQIPESCGKRPWSILILFASIWLSMPCLASESLLTLLCEGEQLRGLNSRQLSRSSLELGLLGTYDDGVWFHTKVDVRTIADHALPERDRFFLREGVIGVGLDRIEFSLGRRILGAGRLDVLQPTNFFLRRDLSDPIEYRQEPIWIARTALFLNRVTLSFTWIPLFEPDLLSWDERNPWRLFPETIDYPGLEDLAADYRKGKRIEPAEGIRSSEYALQMDWYAGKWDIGMIGALGHSRLPTWFEPAAIIEYPNGRVMVELDTVHRPITLLGCDFVYILGSATLRGELAHTWVSLPADRLEEHAYPTGGVSVDYAISHSPFGKNLYVSAQYNFDGTSSRDDGYVDYQHFYRHAGLFRLVVEPTRDISVELESFLNLEDTDRYLSLEFAWTPLTGLQSVIGLVLVHGPQDSFLGGFRENDRLRLMMRYTWTAFLS